MTEHDPINPPHYKIAGEKFETIKIVDDWRLGFSLGNAVKYILRAKHKGNELEDLKKAQWYLRHAEEVGEWPSLSFRRPQLSVSEVAEAWQLPDQLTFAIANIHRGHVAQARERLIYYIEDLAPP